MCPELRAGLALDTIPDWCLSSLAESGWGQWLGNMGTQPQRAGRRPWHLLRCYQRFQSQLSLISQRLCPVLRPHAAHWASFKAPVSALPASECGAARPLINSLLSFPTTTTIARPLLFLKAGEPPLYQGAPSISLPPV